MALVNAPLLSFGASGQIAKTQVYAQWKGRPYVRRYTVPSNPQSASQTETRTTFKWLTNVWKYIPVTAQDAWNEYASNNRMTNRNAWIKQNLHNLLGDANLNDLIASPAVNGGLAAAGITVTPSAGTLTIAVTAPTLPAGWTIVQANALVIRDQDPQSGTLYTTTFGTDTSSPYSIALAGLTASQLYQAFAWFTYQVTPSKRAYGLSIRSTGTPS